MCIQHINFVGVLAQGTWKLIDQLEDPELKDLASRLPQTILHSRASNTVKKYLGAFRRWKLWAVGHNLSPIPARPHEFALYLQYIGETKGSKSAAEEACNAVSWVHSSAGLPPLLSDSFVKATLEGLRRSLAKPVVKKEPATVEMLEAIVEDAERSGSLSDLRLATACLLGFSGFMRAAEVLELRPCDCIISGEMMKIRITGSKTDQLRQGDELLVARTKSRTCPVAMLERYMAINHISQDDQRYFFRPIQKMKNGEKLRESGRISATCLRDLFNRKIAALGFPAREFGLHSLRAGGATAAANAKVPDRLFKRHGRWKSENAKDGYIKDSVESRLEVSKSLGLYLCSYSFLCYI